MNKFKNLLLASFVMLGFIIGTNASYSDPMPVPIDVLPFYSPVGGPDDPIIEPFSMSEQNTVYGIVYDDGSIDIHFLHPVGTAAIALYDEDDDLAGLWQKANGATKIPITLPDAEGEYEILVQLQNGASFVANYVQ